MIGNRGQLLTPTEIFRLTETEKGRREVAEYIWRARTAMAAQHVMETLGVVPDSETQEAVCLAIWDTIFRRDIFQVMDWCKAVVESRKAENLDIAGNA